MTAAAVVEMTVGLLVMAGAVQADSTVINTCPAVITSPGRYLLGADLICGGGDGITITSSDVALALEGHRITAGVGAHIAIVVTPAQFGLPGPDNVSILGPGLITKGGFNTFLAGVSLVVVTHSEVRGITVMGSGNGIVATGPLSGTTDLTIAANTLGQNDSGIVLSDVLSSTISENHVSGNRIGLSISNPDVTGSPTRVSHNIVDGNTGGGLFINVGFATVQNNVISGNGQTGILVQTSLDGATIELEVIDNRLLANTGFDLVDMVPGCTGAVWSGNTFFTANQSCIH
jgi:hypothetical protein